MATLPSEPSAARGKGAVQRSWRESAVLPRPSEEMGLGLFCQDKCLGRPICGITRPDSEYLGPGRDNLARVVFFIPLPSYLLSFYCFLVPSSPPAPINSQLQGIWDYIPNNGSTGGEDNHLATAMDP